MSDAATMSFAVVGLGRIGGSLAHHALEKALHVVGFDRHKAADDLVRAGLVEATSLADIAAKLDPPRIVLLYVPAGKVVDALLDELTRSLSPGDVIVDGGNSYWGDSIRRHGRMRAQGFSFVDVGTSGGVRGARYGACFMAGGEEDAVALVEPILRQLAVEHGYVHAGGPGAGHFVKLVHNGIEFGMLQAIAEGVDLLEHYREALPVADILRCWRHGSVIRAWLVDLMEEAYRAQNGLAQVPAYIEDTGEVNWLVDDALRLEVPIPVISQAVMQLLASRDNEKNWARAIAMMRHGFGGHPFGADESIARERQESRMGGFPRADRK
ncbi:MAG: phosphogluconate dehydrogenase (NAD(+)-dependent, decarboxylating) [Betaproteobacteria bacterium]